MNINISPIAPSTHNRKSSSQIRKNRSLHVRQLADLEKKSKEPKLKTISLNFTDSSDDSDTESSKPKDNPNKLYIWTGLQNIQENRNLVREDKLFKGHKNQRLKQALNDYNHQLEAEEANGLKPSKNPALVQKGKAIATYVTSNIVPHNEEIIFSHICNLVKTNYCDDQYQSRKNREFAKNVVKTFENIFAERMTCRFEKASLIKAANISTKNGHRPDIMKNWKNSGNKNDQKDGDQSDDEQESQKNDKENKCSEVIWKKGKRPDVILDDSRVLEYNINKEKDRIEGHKYFQRKMGQELINVMDDLYCS